ncbi:hypothetical protein WK00_06865 [Burkholderia ubonensis]|nr:hypothetical protein WK00_06865 [Burkholderia ubonensis]
MDAGTVAEAGAEVSATGAGALASAAGCWDVLRLQPATLAVTRTTAASATKVRDKVGREMDNDRLLD